MSIIYIMYDMMCCRDETYDEQAQHMGLEEGTSAESTSGTEWMIFAVLWAFLCFNVILYVTRSHK